MRFQQSYSTIETHTAGEALRIVTSGVPFIPGKTILEKRRWLKKNLDHVRRGLMLEPRGHADMYGCYLTEPISEKAHFGAIFMHNEGYSDMCGHGIIALATVAVDQGWVPRQSPESYVAIDSPAGFIEAFVEWDGQSVGKVRFLNVPSFLYQSDLKVYTSTFGDLLVDIAFGGAFYAYLNVGQTNLSVNPAYYRDLIQLGHEVKQAVMAKTTIQHPLIPELNELYGTIISEHIDGINPNEDKLFKQRNICVFADREVDRSPTGTGTAGRIAQLYAKGLLSQDHQLYNESIIGTTFEACVIAETKVATFEAIIPEVRGKAAILGFAHWLISPDDELPQGFFLR